MAHPTLHSCSSCWLYSGQCCPLFPNQPSSLTTSAVTAGLGLVHKHCSHSVIRYPNLLFLGRVSSSAYPQATPPPSSWVGMSGVPGSPVSCQHDSGLVQPRWESEASCSQHLLFPSLSWKQKGSDARCPPCSRGAACLWAPQTHSFPIPSLCRSLPASPHHPTNGPQSPADQSCTTVETRSALPMPVSLSHS